MFHARGSRLVASALLVMLSVPAPAAFAASTSDACDTVSEQTAGGEAATKEHVDGDSPAVATAKHADSVSEDSAASADVKSTNTVSPVEGAAAKASSESKDAIAEPEMQSSVEADESDLVPAESPARRVSEKSPASCSSKDRDGHGKENKETRIEPDSEKVEVGVESEVEEPETKKELVSFDLYENRLRQEVVVAEGASSADVADAVCGAIGPAFQSIKASTSNDWDAGSVYNLDVSWDFSTVDTSVAGDYELRPAISVNEKDADKVVYREGSVDYVVTVRVIKKNVIDLSRGYFDGCGLMIFPWMLDDISGISVSFARAGEKLLPAEEYGDIRWDCEGLVIPVWENGRYTVAVECDGVEYRRTFEIKPLLFDVIGGDRDGGDGSGNGAGAGVQPLPSDSDRKGIDTNHDPADSTPNTARSNPETKNSTEPDSSKSNKMTPKKEEKQKQPAPLTEYGYASDGESKEESYSGNHVAVSGRRAKDLASMRNYVTFDFGSETVSVPSRSINEMNLKDDDVLTVEKNGDSSVDTRVNGVDRDIPVTTSLTKDDSDEPNVGMTEGMVAAVAMLGCSAVIVGAVVYSRLRLRKKPA